MVGWLGTYLCQFSCTRISACRSQRCGVEVVNNLTAFTFIIGSQEVGDVEVTLWGAKGSWRGDAVQRVVPFSHHSRQGLSSLSVEHEHLDQDVLLSLRLSNSHSRHEDALNQRGSIDLAASELVDQLIGLLVQEP